MLKRVFMARSDGRYRGFHHWPPDSILLSSTQAHLVEIYGPAEDPIFLDANVFPSLY